MKIKYPGVTALYSFARRSLPALSRHAARTGSIIRFSSPMTEIPIEGDAVLTHKATPANGGYDEESELKFSTREPIVFSPKLAFAVRLADGSEYVLTSREGPANQLSLESTSGTPQGSPAVYTYTLKHFGLPCKAVFPAI